MLARSDGMKTSNIGSWLASLMNPSRSCAIRISSASSPSYLVSDDSTGSPSAITAGSSRLLGGGGSRGRSARGAHAACISCKASSSYLSSWNGPAVSSGAPSFRNSTCCVATVDPSSARSTSRSVCCPSKSPPAPSMLTVTRCCRTSSSFPPSRNSTPLPSSGTWNEDATSTSIVNERPKTVCPGCGEWNVISGGTCATAHARSTNAV
mmetsp:Transcript_57782/g.137845  ORF Transcript_57782/g.137845 Transcript_57782/m.137845 type:complete len:208 (-) Transcript_57782:25-648(-)